MRLIDILTAHQVTHDLDLEEGSIFYFLTHEEKHYGIKVSHITDAESRGTIIKDIVLFGGELGKRWKTETLKLHEIVQFNMWCGLES
jgi:hypothetical protein